MPPTSNFRIIGFFAVFGSFSRFLVVGEAPGGSGDLFSCFGIDLSCSGVEFFMLQIDFPCPEIDFCARRWFFVGVRVVFVVGEGPSGSGDHFPAPESVFHARNRFFVPWTRFFLQKIAFLGFSVGFRGSGDLFSCWGIDFPYSWMDFSSPGIDFHAWEFIFHPGIDFSCWGRPGGNLT